MSVKQSKLQYYAVNFDDPALPGFCSGDKAYFGTANDIRAVVENMLQSDRDRARLIIDQLDRLPNLLGNNLRPVMVRGRSELLVKNAKFHHRNIWGFLHAFRSEEAKIDQIIVKHEGKYLRCCRVAMKNLEIMLDQRFWHEVGDQIFGNRFVTINDPDPNGDRIFRSLLYVEEERFDRSSDAIRSLGEADRIKLRGVFDEILADG